MGESLDSPNDWTQEDFECFASEIDRLYPVDLGIVRAVKVLKDAGFATIESWEGREGHAYPEPTINLPGHALRDGKPWVNS